MDTVVPRDIANPAKSTPPKPVDESVDIYVWKPASGVHAKAPKDPPRREPLPPVVPAAAAPSWARIGRIFLAGAIVGVATITAARLVLKKDHA